MKKSGFVAIIGRPNAGKSSLLNHILGSSLSIVTYKAQTTRDAVRGIHTTDKGQIVFIDTPGLHKAKKGGINEYMVKAATDALDGVSAIWYLIDPTSKVEHERLVLEILEKIKIPIFFIITKSDLTKKNPRQPQALANLIQAEGIKKKINAPPCFFISSKTGEGIDDLFESTWSILKEGPFFYPVLEENNETISDRPVKYFVSEIIRKHVFLCLGEEIPYSCAVEVTMQETKARTFIDACISVERDSQKGMVIGKKGSKIKEIGINARKEIEIFLETKTHLELRVRVVKNWTSKKDALKKLGYSDRSNFRKDYR